MELENMQAAWSQMSRQLEQQKQLTNEIIMEMTQDKYKRKYNTLFTYESLATVICYVFALYVIFNFNALDTWYFKLSGGFILSYFIVIPMLVLRSIRNVSNIDIISNNYKETLVEFAKKKNHMLLIQRSAIALNFILVIAILPVMVKISSDKNIFTTFDNIWYIFIPVMFTFLILASRWGYKCYKSITSSSEKLIRDLDL